MKKGIFFSLAFLAGFIVFSQDYQCIRDNATYFYSDGTNIKAIQIDSVVITDDGLQYYNYPTLGGESYDCLTQFWPSWIGRSVLVKPDGDNVFFNKNNEPITIRTIAELDEEWICYQFPNGNYIIAVIAEIQEMDFLGLNNMVKKINFQAYNSTGTPITHDINSKYLLLSKDYGLIRAINFKVFPDLYDDSIVSPYYCTEFNLVGISDPEVGMQNLNLAAVFNMEIGDEIHHEYGFYGMSNYSDVTRTKEYYLQKSVTSTEISFQTYRCGYSLEIIPNVGTNYDYFKYTAWHSYYIGSDSLVDALPDQLLEVKYDSIFSSYYLIKVDYLGTSGKIRKTILNSFESYEDCIIFLEESSDNYDYYIEGLGHFYSYEIPWFSGESTSPVFFHKGNQEWGTPYSFDCDTLGVGFEQPVVSTTETQLSPNPMHEHSRLTIDNPENKEYQFQLFNLMGVMVREYQFQTNDLIIQRENLTNGIYFYLLSDGQKVIHSGKLVIR